MAENLSLTCYSDILCVWAYISQVRVNEVERKFAGQISVTHRFCSVFGDTAHKIGVGWKELGGYEGYGNHLREVVQPGFNQSTEVKPSPFVCQAWMRFHMIFWTRLISIWHLGVRIATEQRERLFQQGCDAPHCHCHARQQTLQARSRVSAVAGARSGREISVLRSTLTHQRA